MQRLFLGIGPDRRARARLSALARMLAGGLACDRLRWVSAENYHITVEFLGQIADERIAAVVEAADEAAARTAPFSVCLPAVSAFPRAASPRVLALLIEPDPILHGLRRDLARSLHSRGFAVEKRAFKPHLTVARIRGRGALEVALPPVDAIRFAIDTLVLYESRRTDEGTRYLALHRARLATRSQVPV